jgi:hypothetical protein
MPRGRSYSWDTHQSERPVIIEREPNVRNIRPARSHKQPKSLTFGFKFVNPFKSRKPKVRVVRQQARRAPRGSDRLEVVETRERTPEPRGSEDTASMSRGGRQGEFVPLPPRIPIPRQDPVPIIEPVAPPPVRTPEPELERERDWRRRAVHQARLETQRRWEAEQETERVRRAAARERRAVNDLADRLHHVAINERERGREFEDRARRAEYELDLERHLAERERAFQARLRQAEMEVRAEAEARILRRRPVHIVQRDPPLIVDRGAEVLRLAQEAERQRRDALLYRMERDRRRGLPRRRH